MNRHDVLQHIWDVSQEETDNPHVRTIPDGPHKRFVYVAERRAEPLAALEDTDVAEALEAAGRPVAFRLFQLAEDG